MPAGPLTHSSNVRIKSEIGTPFESEVIEEVTEKTGTLTSSAGLAKRVSLLHHIKEGDTTIRFFDEGEEEDEKVCSLR